MEEGEGLVSRLGLGMPEKIRLTTPPFDLQWAGHITHLGIHNSAAQLYYAPDSLPGLYRESGQRDYYVMAKTVRLSQTPEIRQTLHVREYPIHNHTTERPHTGIRHSYQIAIIAMQAPEIHDIQQTP